MLRPLLALVCFFLLLGCGEAITTSTKDARILLMGDSMMAANRNSGRSVADGIEGQLGEEVIDRSVYAARIIYILPITGAAGLSIPAQFQKGEWDWVVLNGGGNDLMFGCGCGYCNAMVDRLISKDGSSGAIPELVARIRKSGAKVVYSGYLRNPGLFTPVRPCRVYGDELDRRLARMDARDPGMIFLPMSDLVPTGDPSLHQEDLVHPSPKGSAAIAARIAAAIRKAESEGDGRS
jgi:lysophospholipase L1-like esterase